MANKFEGHDPIVWTILEGLVVNVLVLIMAIVLIANGIWEFLKTIFGGSDE